MKAMPMCWRWRWVSSRSSLATSSSREVPWYSTMSSDPGSPWTKVICRAYSSEARVRSMMYLSTSSTAAGPVERISMVDSRASIMVR